MDPPHRGWTAQPGGLGSELAQSQAQRPTANFGLNGPQHPTQQSPPSGHAGIAPPNGHFAYQQPSHPLASLPGMNHPSPRPAPPSIGRSEGPQSQHQQGPGFSLPALNQATSQPSAADRERERAREVEQIHIKEEQDRQHREQERQRMEQAPPHQTQPGPPMHLHQPVALGPRTVHGPNGLLGQPGMSGPSHPPPHFPLANGPGASFAGGPMQSTAQAPAGPPVQPGMLMPFPPGPQAAPQQMGQGQGQQPILNDALSYLDQVKVQFHDHPDVYNRFLDIMKDFKGGVIDTPGVIGRVSQLFAGNPGLIQGFNTFLPPGYRIECGAGDDPNAIRVTTPAGTTVQSMPMPRPLSRQDGPDDLRRANGTYTPQPPQGPPMMLSPGGRAVGPVMPTHQHLSPLEAARQQEQQQTMHQQEQRGVNQLQNAVSVATSGAGPRVGASPAPGRGTPLAAQDGMLVDGMAAQVGMEKRGPVEFNHAISYVNKIKTRFASQPDIYKQFLEILQTYQRESKPIQDVYSQVTHLFKTAPDLLDDFKQFLPESAAQAKAAAQARQQAEESVILSNIRGEPPYTSPVLSREVAIGTPSHGRGLPPVGNFAPTPNAKDNKRKRGERQSTAVDADGAAGPTAVKAQFAGPAGKRMKQTHPMPMAKATKEQPPTSPTLIPALPSPLPPVTSSAANSDELNFFDRAKKAISNKNMFNEFLKLCNLFSQDLIDRTHLVHRARTFIGTNPDLMKWLQDFLGYDERDILVENKPRIPGGRVSLSNCRGLGPSYRLLPKRERQKPCSGRDELCAQVLNDEWASHPTWASEDSGFIAHKKNTFEEALHRIEEERHDYDYNIEICNRTIQLLEPIAHHLRRLPEPEEIAYKLPPGLGGQSETIHKRVIIKLYGREKGPEVVQNLLTAPYQVIPVLLNRLKERLETWKMAQREWEKVWRDQTQKMFWRSLDHQLVNARAADKRAFQAKTLQSEIGVKREEMKRDEKTTAGVMRNPQMEFILQDEDVIMDAAHLVLVYIDQGLSFESPRLVGFFREFIPLFFNLDSDWFNNHINARLATNDTPAVDAADEPQSGTDDFTSTRSRKGNGKSNNLLRSALDRGRKSARKDREDSNASASRASTPDGTSNADEDLPIDAPDEAEMQRYTATVRWLEHPIDGNHYENGSIDPNEPYQRSTFRMWSNTPMYCFVRMFVMLYERLLKLKHAEAECRKSVQTANKPKAALVLGILDKVPSDFFGDISPNASYYKQMLGKFEDVIKGEIDFADVEDTLRRFYLQSGYGLYSFEKMVSAIGRFANSVLNSEGKDKSWDIYQLFKRDRVKEMTTAQQQTDYRKVAEKMLKDGELYRIDMDVTTRAVRIFLTKKDDPTFDDSLSTADKDHLWRYYIASYTALPPTEAVDYKKLTRPLLARSLRNTGTDLTSYPRSPDAEGEAAADWLQRRLANMRGDESLVIRIAVNSYHPMFQPNTQEGWFVLLAERDQGKDGVAEAAETLAYREETLKDGFLMMNDGMRGLSKDEVESANENFETLVDGSAKGNNGDGMEIDG